MGGGKAIGKNGGILPVNKKDILEKPQGGCINPPVLSSAAIRRPTRRRFPGPPAASTAVTSPAVASVASVLSDLSGVSGAVRTEWPFHLRSGQPKYPQVLCS